MMLETAMLTDNLTYKEVLAESIQKALGQTTFSNRMMIAPRRLRQIGAEEVESVLAYFQNQDRSAVIQHGHRLAGEGLGRGSVFSLCTALRRACWEAQATDKAPVLFDLTEEYTTSFLEGYLQGLEEEIRQEQERTRQAYIRSLEK